ncbi:carbohydrate ABC transporter permease [Paenibacillus sp. strain BS8-2]
MNVKPSRMKQSRSDVVFDYLNYAVMIVMTILFIYPLVFILSASFSDPNMVWSGKMWLFPKGFTIEGYQLIFENDAVWSGYRNSLIYMVVGTIINVILTIMTAYPLSRKDFVPRNFLMLLYTFTMFFGGGLIPTYLLVKNLDMVNTMWALIIPNAIVVWNLIITRTYFQTSIPQELREAAFIDGSTNIHFLIRIVLPLSAPILAIITLFYSVSHWNEYFRGLIYLTDRSLYPLQLILREILVKGEVAAEMLSGQDALDAASRMRVTEMIKYGVIIVASIPLLIMYPFVQRYFVKGIMVGSLKG